MWLAVMLAILALVVPLTSATEVDFGDPYLNPRGDSPEEYQRLLKFYAEQVDGKPACADVVDAALEGMVLTPSDLNRLRHLEARSISRIVSCLLHGHGPLYR